MLVSTASTVSYTHLKLKMVKEFRSISSQKLEWKIITPNDKADWINQRDGLFDNLITLAPEKKFALNAQSIFSCLLYTSLEAKLEPVIRFFNGNAPENVNAIFGSKEAIEEYKMCIRDRNSTSKNNASLVCKVSGNFIISSGFTWETRAS